MEQERLAHENEEKDRAARMQKIKEQFSDQDSQWEKDKAFIQDLASQEKVKDAAVADGVQETEQVVKVYVLSRSKSI